MKDFPSVLNCKIIADSLNQLHLDKIEFHNKHYGKLINQQQQITKMLDNLYIDKVKGRITESEYEKFYISFYDEAAEIKSQLDKLGEAQDNYFITAKYVLDLVNRAHELFESSEVEEKRQLIKLVLQNLRLEDDKLLWDAVKPFDTLLNVSDSQGWCGLPNAFRNKEATMGFTLQHIQTIYSSFRIELQELIF